MTKKPNNANSNANNNAHRVITFLTRDELDFLDKLGKDALFSAGTKLSRSKIISAIVNVIRKLGINGTGLSSKSQLEAKIIQAMKDLAEAIKTNLVNRARALPLIFIKAFEAVKNAFNSEFIFTTLLAIIIIMTP